MSVEVKCNECENCTGNSCKIYGENAAYAVKMCAKCNFKNYKKIHVKR